MFQLCPGAEHHYILFKPVGMQVVPLVVFKGFRHEGEADRLHFITSVQDAHEKLGNPESIGYKALCDLISSNHNDFTAYGGLNWIAIRTSSTLLNGIQVALADGTYPHHNDLEFVTDLMMNSLKFLD